MNELRVALTRKVRDEGLKQMQVAAAANVDQATISRVLGADRPIRRLGPGMKKLCKYAGIPTHATEREYVRLEDIPSIVSAVVDVWDGSSIQEKRIAALIRAAAAISASPTDARPGGSNG